MVLQSTNGYPEVVLTEACDVALFYKVADWLQHKIGITFSNKTEQSEGITWQFQFAGAVIALRYVPGLAISLCPGALAHATDQERAVFKKLVETLQFD